MQARVDARTGMEQLNRNECMRLLAGSTLGRLAVIVAEQPLVFPVNFALDGDAIVFRTNRGTKVHGAHLGPVAFECDGIDRSYHTGWSVLVQGVVEEVHDELEVARLERLPLKPWCEAPKPIWMRLRHRTVSGRRIPPHGSPTVAVVKEEE